MRTSPYLVSVLLFSLGLGFAACGGVDAEGMPDGTGGGGNEGNPDQTGGVGLANGSGGVPEILNPTGGLDENECLGDNPPDTCRLVPSQPSCGDGALNQPDIELCDDGNTFPGDGCNGICHVEPNFICPTPGQPCVVDYACGNGEIEPGEVCDDGNTSDDDGCSADCTQQSRNYLCITPGEPCTRVVVCGDGRVAGDETCEDGNAAPGDGCDADCNVESGWLCLTVGAPCEPSPMCGDGVVTPDLGEVCDDGNTAPDDGCAEDCTFLGDGWACPTPGAPCVNLNVCGDGMLTGAEGCDDGALVDGDGCSSICTVEPGYECPFAGAPCIALCGDGILLPAMEICDDGNNLDGDGCTSICEWEDGFACTGTAPNYDCKETVCGDGFAEGNESCDDQNNDLGDGCTPLCDVEPSCTTSGCTSTCGDGLVLGDEVCDDGDNVNGDGCSSACQIEPGYECHQPELGESIEVPVVYRDFKESHPDFEPGAIDCNELSPGMVGLVLDDARKPAMANGASPNGKCNFVSSARSFAEWYRDVDGTNFPIATTMTLWDNGDGGYVNRWGDDGEQWETQNPSGITWCADVGGSCADCNFPYTECYDPCTPWGEGNNQICADGTGEPTLYDGNPFFFPIDDGAFTGNSERGTARLPPAYGGWDDEPGDPLHNFHFTSEVRFWFEYDETVDQTLEFTGDDDVWVFINNQLAVDLGGIHIPVTGSVNMRAEARSLMLTNGTVYEIVVFQAERQTEGSSYKLTLSGFNAAPSECGPICGDGHVSPGEQCDDGENLGGYGNCNPDCTRGAYCGDGVVEPDVEACDDGQNTSAYSRSGATGGCAPGCRAVPYCGDGLVQGEFGERCDDGVNDGVYGGCRPDCQRAPFCGDGVVDVEQGEQCDDGLNNGAYNTCAPGCVLGPRCGDGVLAEDWGEYCDDGNHEPGDGCSPNCGPEGICGDGVVDTEADPPEACDDGVNDGGYGECAPSCQPGPRCGDGVVQTESGEVCDDGRNEGGYGECAPGCVLGPHCGDGVHQPGFELCDDGNDIETDSCTSSCVDVILVPR
ncbi:MAG: DUF4215 domain-containing protein [Polyangiaceae bacterium]|nr:DUF4215 domain-containing protein [Polyangiaceae bacterium]